MCAMGAPAHLADGLNCFGPALPALHTASDVLAPSLLFRLRGLARPLTPSVPVIPLLPLPVRLCA